MSAARRRLAVLAAAGVLASAASVPPSAAHAVETPLTASFAGVASAHDGVSSFDSDIELPTTSDCGDTGVVCTADDAKALSSSTAATVAAPPPLTAALEGVPATHDTSTAFSFRLRFSTAVTTSDRVLRDSAFDITGGTVSGALRVDGRSDLWQITVQPDTVTADTVDDDITVTLPVTVDCAHGDAVCTAALRPLSEPVTASVEGPLVEAGLNTAGSERVTLGVPPGGNENKNRVGVRVDETDATLSALTLMEGSNSVSLTPVFASATTAYRAWVANRVSSVTVTATKNDDGASVAITGDSDTSTPNTAVLLLAEGANPITVTVTAEDNTTGTYTITAVREASAPTADPTALMTEKMTAGQDGTDDIYGYQRVGSNYGALTGNEFEFDGATYTITNLFWNGPNGDLTLVVNRLYLCLRSLPSNLVYDLWTLRVGSDDYRLADSQRVGTTHCVRWARTDPWAHGDVVTVKMFGNHEASGAPGVSGTAQVGQMLTASTSGIADLDGKTKADGGESGFAYGYQWVRVDSDGTNPQNISGATSDTYVPVKADVGKRVMVKVTFTDDRNNDEELTSAAYPAAGRILNDVPPMLDTATVNGVSLVLTYDRELDGDSDPAVGQYTVAVAGTDVTPTGVDAAGRTVTLTLGTAVTSGQSVTLDYRVPAMNPVQDSDGTPAGALDGQAVHNVVGDTTVPTLDSAQVDGDVLVLSYSEALDSGSEPAVGQFDVKVTPSGGSESSRTVSTVDVSGSKVTLTLVSAVDVTDSVTLDYIKPTSNPLQDVAGNDAAAFSGRSVDNNLPMFAQATLTREITENSAANVNVGAVIPAATGGAVGATLVYSMEGTDAASFNFNVTTRQISTKAGVTYDYEMRTSYEVTIKVTDGTDNDTVVVTINLIDVAVEVGPAPLSALSLTGIEFNETFEAGVTAYTASVAHAVTRATVTATSQATVTILPVDASDAVSLPGHQVNFGVGETVITVTVQDGSEQSVYTVTVTREGPAVLPSLLPGQVLLASFEMLAGTGNAGGVVYGYGAAASGDTLTPDTFEFGGVTYRVTEILNNEDLNGLFVKLDPHPAAEEIAGLSLQIATDARRDGQRFRLWDLALTVGRKDAEFSWGFAPAFGPYTNPFGREERAGTTVNLRVVTTETMPPVLISTTVSGSTLVLTYSEILAQTSVPAPADYAVTVDGQPVAVDNVDVDGSTVTLTLATPVQPDQTVQLIYSVPSFNPVEDQIGNEAAAIDITIAPRTDQTGRCNRDLQDRGLCDLGTATTLTPGVPLQATISTSNDVDWFRVELEDKEYRIDMEGASTGRGTLRDPYLRGMFAVFAGPDVRNYQPDGRLDGSGEDIETIWYSLHDDCAAGERNPLTDCELLDEGTYYNDDGGTGHNARLYLRDFPTGAHYLEARGLGPATGTYTITLTEVTDDDTDDRALTLSAQTSAVIDFPGDTDTFTIDLTADTTYTITLRSQGWDGWSRIDIDTATHASTRVDTPYDGSTDTYTITPATTGTHTLRIIGRNRDRHQRFATGNYTITIAG